jgi:hypothetical protein
MRKRYLSVLIVVIVFVIAFYYLSLPTSPPNILNQLQSQGNQTQGNRSFFNFPFIPGQTAQASSNKSSGGAGGSAGGAGAGEGAGAGGEVAGEESEYIQLNHISIDSTPEGLKIFASYYINGIRSSLMSDAPFNLEADSNSLVCILPAFIIGNGFLNWTVDGQYCQFSACELSSYNRTETLYSDYGCLINMNENHSIILNYTLV